MAIIERLNSLLFGQAGEKTSKNGTFENDQILNFEERFKAQEVNSQYRPMVLLLITYGVTCYMNQDWFFGVKGII